MTFQLKPLLPRHVQSLQAYQPGMTINELARKYALDPDNIVKLASNENPLGASPRALEALAATSAQVHRYPDQHALAAALAMRYGVSPDMIVLGNGSNDILDLIARAFLQPGAAAVSSQYAFPIYALVTQLAGAENIVVPAQEYAHDLAAMQRAITPQTKIVWIANPNNPTGSFVPYDELKKHMSSLPTDCIVVLDEAYYEYLDDTDRADATQWLREFPNLILVRTFSKIYGLAGLRIGYAIANAQVAEVLNRVRQPFNVSLPAMAAAEAALGDSEFVQRSRAHNREGRAYLTAELQKLGLEVVPSHGNFVVVRVPDAKATHETLLSRGIIVRPLAPSGLPDFLRVSVGLPAENERFVATLRDILNEL